MAFYSPLFGRQPFGFGLFDDFFGPPPVSPFAPPFFGAVPVPRTWVRVAWPEEAAEAPVDPAKQSEPATGEVVKMAETAPEAPAAEGAPAETAPAAEAPATAESSAAPSEPAAAPDAPAPDSAAAGTVAAPPASAVAAPAAARPFSLAVTPAEDAYSLTYAVPAREGLQLQLSDDGSALTFRFEENKEEEGRKSFRRVERTWYLPEDADGDKIEAKWGEGGVEVKVARKEFKPKEKRIISVL